LSLKIAVLVKLEAEGGAWLLKIYKFEWHFKNLLMTHIMIKISKCQKTHEIIAKIKTLCGDFNAIIWSFGNKLFFS